MDLLAADGREPLQELVKRRASIEVVEERRDSKASAAEAPRAAKFPRASVDSATEPPIHTASLSPANPPEHLNLKSRMVK